ncbi:MAG: PD40 domain-containing protein [Bacteroidetes bacterium]|nr:PD40 domain-containing protein [Bacteroidota bacterium]
MKFFLTYVFLVTAMFGCNWSCAQSIYPDAQLPNDTPRLFAVGILSDGFSNRDFTMSPKGDEIFFTIQQPRFALSAILHVVRKGGKWSAPEVAPFSGNYRDLEAAFSPDGQYIYFSSDRPVNGNAKKDFDIWRVKRLPDGKWGEPENLGPNVNSTKDEFYPSVTKSGNLYFTTEPENGRGSEDIVVCKPGTNGYGKPELLPDDIDTKYDEFNAFVDPDEQFILFSSYGRADDMGRGDIYISHKGKNGEWLPVKHLPAVINSSALDYCPYVTIDKKYLIFTSNRLNPDFADGKTRNIERIKTLLSSPGNGLDDIYWVKFDPEWLK